MNIPTISTLLSPGAYLLENVYLGHYNGGPFEKGAYASGVSKAYITMSGDSVEERGNLYAAHSTSYIIGAKILINDFIIPIVGFDNENTWIVELADTGLTVQNLIDLIGYDGINKKYFSIDFSQSGYWGKEADLLTLIDIAGYDIEALALIDVFVDDGSGGVDCAFGELNSGGMVGGIDSTRFAFSSDVGGAKIGKFFYDVIEEWSGVVFSNKAGTVSMTCTGAVDSNRGYYTSIHDLETLQSELGYPNIINADFTNSGLAGDFLAMALLRIEGGDEVTFKRWPTTDFTLTIKSDVTDSPDFSQIFACSDSGDGEVYLESSSTINGWNFGDRDQSLVSSLASTLPNIGGHTFIIEVDAATGTTFSVDGVVGTLAELTELTGWSSPVITLLERYDGGQASQGEFSEFTLTDKAGDVLFRLPPDETDYSVWVDDPASGTAPALPSNYTVGDWVDGVNPVTNSLAFFAPGAKYADLADERIIGATFTGFLGGIYLSTSAAGNDLQVDRLNAISDLQMIAELGSEGPGPKINFANSGFDTGGIDDEVDLAAYRNKTTDVFIVIPESLFIDNGKAGEDLMASPYDNSQWTAGVKDTGEAIVLFSGTKYADVTGGDPKWNGVLLISEDENHYEITSTTSNDAFINSLQTLSPAEIVADLQYPRKIIMDVTNSGWADDFIGFGAIRTAAGDDIHLFIVDIFATNQATRKSARQAVKYFVSGLPELAGIDIFSARNSPIGKGVNKFINVYFDIGNVNRKSMDGAVDSAKISVRLNRIISSDVQDLLDDMAKPIEQFIEDNCTLFEAVDDIQLSSYSYDDEENSTFSYLELSFAVEF